MVYEWCPVCLTGIVIRYALRRLRLNPGFTAVAVLTLGVGIGANTAVFSAVNAFLFAPLPVERGSEIVAFNSTFGGGTVPTMSVPNYRDIRDRNTTFAGMFAYRITPLSLGFPEASQRAWGYLVSGNYFPLLGIRPAQGRLLTPEDDQRPDAHPVAVLGYTCWQKRFGGDPGVVGRVVKVNGLDYTILGVTPKGFFGTERFFTPDVFIPLMMQKQLEGFDYLERRQSSNTFVSGRLKPGVSSEQAEQELKSIAGQLAREFPNENGGLSITLTPPGLAGDYIRPAVRGFGMALFGASALALLLACVNLASLLLARASDRPKDTAIRLALGAGRGRLVGQLLTENFLVALAGAVVGVLIALWVTDLLAAFRPPIDIPLSIHVAADASVFWFALAVATVTTLLFGMVPALQATRTDLVPALKNETAASKGRGWLLRDYVVATQVALSALLLVCSVLVVRSLEYALKQPLGFEGKGVATASYDLNLLRYEEPRAREFHKRLLERVRGLPGVESAGLINNLLLSLGVSNEPVYVEGRPAPKPADAPSTYAYSISPGYMKTMRTRLLEGRDLDENDGREGRRVALVNQAFARNIINEPQVIGRKFRMGPGVKPVEIVGVVEDGKYFSLSDSNRPAVFLPLDVWYSPGVSLVARTRLPEAEAAALLRGVIREMDPAVALFNAGPVMEQIDFQLFPARLAASALGSFGILALVLAGTGIYGVMAYAVSRRTREIGIRMAIGATRGDVLGSILRHAAVLVGVGTALGVAAAVAVARVIGGLLPGVRPSDPFTYAVVAALMAGIAALACWIPASRAIRIDPIRALRQE